VAKTGDPLNNTLKGLIEYIRFPVMSTEDVALKVTNAKILSPQTVLELFTYLGQTDDERSKSDLPKSLQMYSNKPRKGRKPPLWFKWDAHRKHSSLAVSDDGLTVTSTTTSYFQPVIGDTELKNGEWEFEINIIALHSHSQALTIGVVPAYFDGWSSSFMIGYPGHAPGWSYSVGGSQKMHGTTVTYGARASAGDRVKVRVNLDKKDIEFYLNGVSQGVAYTDVTGPVRPAMSL